MKTLKPDKTGIMPSLLRLCASVPLCLCALVPLCLSQASAAVLPSGADYQLENSVIDNGGGQRLSGGDYRSRGAIARASMPDNIGLLSGGEYVNRAGFYNPPHFTFQKGLPVSLSMPGGEASLSLPPFSVDKMRFDITLNRNPLNQPMSVDPAKINEASNKIVNNDGSWSRVYANNLSEMAIFDEQDFYARPLAQKGVLTVAYKDANNDGILDASNPPVRVETLNAWILDESVNSWVRMPDAGSDPAAKTLSVYFGIPGVYALIGALSTEVDDVRAYPVPFRPYGPLAGAGPGQTGMDAAGITFQSVPQAGNIEIYTLDGRLVRKIAIPETGGIQTVLWNVRNGAGDRAASGVYIWRVVSGSNAKTGKLMVIW